MRIITKYWIYMGIISAIMGKDLVGFIAFILMTIFLSVDIIWSGKGD